MLAKRHRRQESVEDPLVGKVRIAKVESAVPPR